VSFGYSSARRHSENGKKARAEPELFFKMLAMRHPIPPGSTIGLLGGGQLGRMFAIAARRMGYRVHTFEPSSDSPAGQVSDREFVGSFSDETLVAEFAESVAVVTFEFENIPFEVLQQIARSKPVYPRPEVLLICQNRQREKTFLRDRGYPVVPFEIVTSQTQLNQARTRLGKDAVLKTADFGYDGKGQVRLRSDTEFRFADFDSPSGVLESWIAPCRELSVVCARGLDEVVVCFPVAENIHRNHILDTTIVPGRFDKRVKLAAREIAEAIAVDLDVVGIIAVEFFVQADGKLFVNELAPRPHNSGHYTFDACLTSQFEQQLRAVCGLPLGATDLFESVVMINLLGDLWRDGQPPDWSPILSHPRAKFHLYGKSEGRPGRKMGHFCVLADNVDYALSEALKLKEKLAASVRQ
jgi:5-(carboxyamino)imidazole ribonucleotide synthase